MRKREVRGGGGGLLNKRYYRKKNQLKSHRISVHYFILFLLAITDNNIEKKKEFVK